MVIQTIKKILLSLIFTSSITFAIIYLLIGIQVEHDNPHQSLLFLCWILVSVLFLAAASSLCWIINVNKGFWLWKLPALLILPFSIPFLILDYFESRKTTTIVERPLKYKTIIAGIIAAFSLLSCFLLILLLFAIKSMIKEKNFEYWILFPLTESFLSVFGAIFLLLSTYHPNNKSFIVLRWFATPLIWFYLLLEVIDKKQSHYFFEHNNISPAIIPETAILQDS